MQDITNLIKEDFGEGR